MAGPPALFRSSSWPPLSTRSPSPPRRRPRRLCLRPPSVGCAPFASGTGISKQTTCVPFNLILLGSEYFQNAYVLFDECCNLYLATLFYSEHEPPSILDLDGRKFDWESRTKISCLLFSKFRKSRSKLALQCVTETNFWLNNLRINWWVKDYTNSKPQIDQKKNSTREVDGCMDQLLGNLTKCLASEE